MQTPNPESVASKPPVTGAQLRLLVREDLPRFLEFDPATLVLTSYGRMQGGTTQGDPGVADRFRSLFFSI